MATSEITSDPPPILRPITESVWCAESIILMGPGVRFPIRMVVIRQADGGLWVWSPIAMDDELAAEIDAIGPVRHLVAPNLYHHVHMTAAAARYPQAQVWAPRGLEKKQPKLRIDGRLEDGLDWGGELRTVAVRGADGMAEFAFLHRASRTLLLTDLVFNIDDSPRGITRFVMWIFGSLGRLNRSRVWNMMIKDRKAFGASVAQILEMDFDRAIPAHGAILESNAKAALTEVLARDVDRA